MNPIKYSDLITPEGNDTIQQAIDELNNLIKVYGEAKSVIVESAKQQVEAVKSVSGATASQREKLCESIEASEKLAKEIENVTSLERRALSARRNLNEAKREANEIDKLTKKLLDSEKGSYNALSAEYSINMIKLKQH